VAEDSISIEVNFVALLADAIKFKLAFMDPHRVFIVRNNIEIALFDLIGQQGPLPYHHLELRILHLVIVKIKTTFIQLLRLSQN